MTDTADAYDLADLLARHGQEHLLEGLDALDAERREAYLQRLQAVDWAELAHPAQPVAIDDVGPSRVIDFAQRERRGEELRAAGERCYGQGAVAVVMVAGGQGTRLGFSGPKGCFEIGAHSGKSIYQIQAEKAIALSRRLGREVPFLVLTSQATDDETRDFFAAHDGFGLSAGQLRFFTQGTAPSIDREGRALLSGPGALLENPDGHGGCFQALVSSGELRRLREEGIRQLVYIQVDNILAPIDDPELVGLAELEDAEVVTKVLEKAHPDEKVGHLVRLGERDRIVEYTEVTPEQTRALGDDGQPIYRWGSPAMHCWSIAFLGRLEDAGYKLPLHRSTKPLKAWVDGALREVPGFKNERFIFDLVPQAAISIGLQIDRDQEFAPVKNAEGSDSPATAQAIASACWAEWLRAAGVRVELDPGDMVELSPLVGGTRAQLVASWDGRVDAVTGDYYLEERS